MTTPDETWRTLYGTSDGRWLLLTGMVGTVSPPYIAVGVESRIVRLDHLGDPADVVRSVYRRLADAFAGGRTGYQAGGRTGGADVQQAMSEMLGVSQQSVSRYVRGTSTPDLKPDGWSNLVRAHFADTPADQLGVSVEGETLGDR
ncbi:helix-turn-helix transcriptional regulator [Dactylosporangium sp. NPDC000244]|uniref:helix-turn-helix domain-containing protein n=1 Tax=Dactylosporangium sp. NPDC000244 TaxID=3154365 RepID=UPI00332DC55C